MKAVANLKSTLDRFADVPFVIEQLELWNADENHPASGNWTSTTSESAATVLAR